MKLPAARIDEVIRKPPPGLRAALIYGPDAGLVHERADRLCQAVCRDLADPFRIADVTGAALLADPPRLADEVAALSLTGGRRVVRVREAGDGLAPLLGTALADAGGDTLIVLEAGELPPRSSLRRLCEGDAAAAAIACYPDTARDLAGVVRESLGAHGIVVSGEATSYLLAHLGGDRLVTRSELEKLALYVGDGARVELADAVACVGDTTTLSVDELVFAAAEGDAGRLDTLLQRCLQEGESPVGLLRAAQRHIQRLHLAAARVAGGAAPDEAMRALRPPVFFKLQDRFRSQLAAWSPSALADALLLLTRAELDSKRTVLPQAAVIGEALLALARRRG